MKQSTLFGNLNLLEGLCTSGAIFAATLSFNAFDDDGQTKIMLGKSNRDDAMKKKTDTVLVLTTCVPAALMLLSATSDTLEFGKEQASEKRLKNANGFLDWLIIAGLAYAAYRFKVKYGHTLGFAVCLASALLYFYSMISTTEDAAAAAQVS